MPWSLAYKKLSGLIMHDRRNIAIDARKCLRGSLGCDEVSFITILYTTGFIRGGVFVADRLGYLYVAADFNVPGLETYA